MKSTSNLDISLLFLFVFLCFDHFYPIQFADFLLNFTLANSVSYSFTTTVSRNHPENGKKFFLLQKDQDLGTMWNSVVEFLMCSLEKKQNEK